MRTANPEVYVAGDATGRHQILHLANQEGTVAGHNAAGTAPERSMDYRLKMSVIFTDPPFAQVGLTGAEAAARGDEVLAGRARFPETGRAITMGVEHGLWKVFAERETGELLGSVLLGPRADDLVHLISLVMLYRGRVPDLVGAPWYHPTLSEVMLNLVRDLAAQVGGCRETLPGLD
jgi:pyruvate/2-oxoglutarate dehydrogenase complex dihydrolipoamide dehydrogenase (E3) component